MGTTVARQIWALGSSTSKAGCAARPVLLQKVQKTANQPCAKWSHLSAELRSQLVHLICFRMQGVAECRLSRLGYRLLQPTSILI